MCIYGKKKQMSKQSEPLKLNLGCGVDHRPGFVNIDAVEAVHPDVVHDLTNALPYEDGSATEVIAQDILEHFIYDDFVFVISEIARVLAPGGVLRVRVPNIDAIFEQFDEDHEVRNIFLYGSTAHRTDTGVFGAHKIGFTRQRLVAELLVYGLQISSLAEVDTNFEATFTKGQPTEVENILFLNQALSIGGAEVFDTDLLAEFKERGIALAAYTNNTYFAHMLHFSDVSTLGVPFVADLLGNVKGLLKAVFFVPLLFVWYGMTLFKHRSVDVLVMSGFTEKVLATVWAKLFGIPVVWIEFGPLSAVFSKFFGLPKVLYRLQTSLPDTVIVPSQNTVADLLQSARISLAKLKVIPCGTALEAVESFEDITRPVIVCPSRLEAGKGQDILISAMKEVIKKIPSAQLHVIGEGDFGVTLKKQVEKLKLGKSVVFHGRVKDIREHLAKAQIVAFPSVWPLEGFGLVAIEAMALAKPVVAFNRGPTNEIIVDEQTGLLAKPGDPQALASALLTLLRSAKKREDFGSAGLARFKENYTIEAVADQYQLALRNAIAWNKAEELLEKLEVEYHA